MANKPTIGTAVDTKRERFGNSAGENDDIVRRIRIPDMTVAFTIIRSLRLKSVFGFEEAEEDDDIAMETYFYSP